MEKTKPSRNIPNKRAFKKDKREKNGKNLQYPRHRGESLLRWTVVLGCLIGVLGVQIPLLRRETWMSRVIEAPDSFASTTGAKPYRSLLCCASLLSHYCLSNTPSIREIQSFCLSHFFLEYHLSKKACPRMNSSQQQFRPSFELWSHVSWGCLMMNRSTNPKWSMCGAFTHIYHKSKANVGKYFIHGAYGIECCEFLRFSQLKIHHVLSHTMEISWDGGLPPRIRKNPWFHEGLGGDPPGVST